MLTKEHILSEIQRTSRDGAALGKELFEKETGIKESDWSGIFWTRWSDAVQEAGFEPNEFQGALPEKYLIECLVAVIEDFGHFPTWAELKLKCRQDPDLPSVSVFNRLGRKGDRARRVVEYCEANPEHSNLIELVAPHATPVDQNEESAGDPNVAIDGYVYLIQHGNRREYKIGKTFNPIRREGEIRLAMPETVTPIHTIRTDDPSGIEAYWHNRFKSKRLEGEWFSLTAEDVRAFKKRKYM